MQYRCSYTQCQLLGCVVQPMLFLSASYTLLLCIELYLRPLCIICNLAFAHLGRFPTSMDLVLSAVYGTGAAMISILVQYISPSFLCYW